MIKVLTKEEFTKKVLKTITTKNCEPLEAVLLMSEEYGIEVESAAKLIDKSLKEMIESDARNMHLLKKKDSLPI